nr:putative phage abortive infection protein [Massilia sp. ST3]
MQEYYVSAEDIALKYTEIPLQKIMSSIKELQDQTDEEVSNFFAEKMLRDGRRVFWGIAVAALSALALYAGKFGFTLADTKDEWGVFGDFLGGLLNPIVGIATVFLVLLNARLQRLELRNSLREMKNSNSALEKQNKSIRIQEFQNVFFNWLNTYRDAVNSVSTAFPNGKSYSGQGALLKIHKHHMMRPEVERVFANRLTGQDFNSLFNTSTVSSAAAEQEAEDAILKAWELTKQIELENLEVPMRSLLGLMEWIDNQSFEIPLPQKHQCFRIIRANLSSAELIFLFYESWSLSTRQINIIKEFSVLEKLPMNFDPLVIFMKSRANHLD